MKIINALQDEFNLAGLNIIFIVPTIGISSVPEPDITKNGGIPLGLITLLSPYEKWIPVYHTLDTGMLQEESDITDQGPLHKYLIECFVPKDYIYRQQAFQELLQLDHFVVIKDNNDQWRFIGNGEGLMNNRGMQVKWKYSTGIGSKGRNGYQLSFYYESDVKAFPAADTDTMEIETSVWI